MQFEGEWELGKGSVRKEEEGVQSVQRLQSGKKPSFVRNWGKVSVFIKWHLTQGSILFTWKTTWLSSPELMWWWCPMSKESGFLCLVPPWLEYCPCSQNPWWLAPRLCLMQRNWGRWWEKEKSFILSFLGYVLEVAHWAEFSYRAMPSCKGGWKYGLFFLGSHGSRKNWRVCSYKSRIIISTTVYSFDHPKNYAHPFHPWNTSHFPSNKIPKPQLDAASSSNSSIFQ